MDYKKEFIILLQTVEYRYDLWNVFTDFLCLSAVAISNVYKHPERDNREIMYKTTIDGYPKNMQQEFFPKLLSLLVMALEENLNDYGFKDILGEVFHELEFHNKWKGQFFTPQHISDFMAMIMLGSKDSFKNSIRQKGFISLNEPCVGSGVMVLSFANAMRRENIDYSSNLFVHAQDIDIRCVYMSYIQLSLYGIPAVVIHGNTLMVECLSAWYTPMFFQGKWAGKLQKEDIYPEEENMFNLLRNIV